MLKLQTLLAESDLIGTDGSKSYEHIKALVIQIQNDIRDSEASGNEVLLQYQRGLLQRLQSLPK